MLWCPGRYGFTLLTVTAQMVHGVVLDRVSQTQFWLSVSMLRILLMWESLVLICSSWTDPGVVMGDFTVIRHSLEVLGGRLDVVGMVQFDETLLQADLVEPRVSGPWSTLSNRQLGLGLF